MSDEEEEKTSSPAGPAGDAMMAVEWVPVAAVRRYGGNPRRNAKAVAKVRASLDAFGWRQPIVLDAASVIIVGDTRYLAAVERGDETVPVHFARDLSPEQAKAYRIADNRVHEEAEWDDDLLTAELRDLLEGGVDLSVTGMSATEVQKLLSGEDDPALTPVTVAPLPTMTWVLIGIPTVRYIEIAEQVDAIAMTPEIFCELTANSDDQAAPHRKVAELKTRTTPLPHPLPHPSRERSP